MITEAIANQVWDVLIREAGAEDSDSHRLAFVVSVVGNKYVSEYRFCGNLGFGGKVFLRDERGWQVYYYPEDRKDERDAIVARTNNALAAVPNPIQ